MNLLKYIVINIIETLLRMLPFPCKTGLIKIGNPNRNSPVFLTCNFHLTVERLKRSLNGIDCYLLVANSHGINVWCASTGGLLTQHSVISVLKTSGIESLVDHRKVILPQLAAPGVEAKVVTQKTNWHVIWGPVYAKDIPAFLENKFKKTSDMRQVSFPLIQRLEMAIAWAFPISAIATAIIYFLWRDTVILFFLLIWALSFLIFLGFPLYQRWLITPDKHVGFIFFDFGKGGFQLILWGLFMLGLIFYLRWSGMFSYAITVRWAIASFAVILLLSMDLAGSTPLYKSGLHEDRLLTIFLDTNECKGAGFCEQVCPKNCFVVNKTQHLATIPGRERCVQCGACIVQCPFDALYFKRRDGSIIPPRIIKKFKLNIMGKREQVIT